MTLENIRGKIVHAWREVETYVRYMTDNQSFDLATAWNRDKHSDRIDIFDPFKRRTSARIEFGFTSGLMERLDV